MSLDARIRHLIREEAQGATAGAPAGDGGCCDELKKEVSDLRAEVSSLHEHQHQTATDTRKLDDRVKALEAKALEGAAEAGKATGAARRGRRSEG